MDKEEGFVRKKITINPIGATYHSDPKIRAQC